MDVRRILYEVRDDATPICWQSYRSSVHLRKDTVKKIVDCHKTVMYISKSLGTVSTGVFVSRHIHPDI